MKIEVEYIIYNWYPPSRRYVPIGRYRDYRRAVIMMNKSYYQKHNRKLVRKTTELILKAKAGKNV